MMFTKVWGRLNLFVMITICSFNVEWQHIVPMFFHVLQVFFTYQGKVCEK
jgi:hypothetical protein